VTKGQQVSHPVWGLGLIIGVEDSIKLNDYRYAGSVNIYVKFDTGGPEGFAENSTNDIKDLQTVLVAQAIY
jgi:hypothetical protein